MQDRNEGRREKALAVLTAAVLDAGGRLENRTNLYKAFWKARLHHMARHGEELVDWPVVKMPNGPGPDGGRDLVEDLVERGFVLQVRALKGAYEAFDLHLRDPDAAEAFVRRHLTDRERESVRKGVEEVRSLTAAQVSDLSHRDSRAWNEADMGREIDIYVDLIRDDEEVDAIRERLKRDAEAVEKVFGTE